MDNNKQIYLVMMAIGTILPWYFFSGFISAQGMDLTRFLASMYENGAAAGAVTDLFISAAVFWVWSYADAEHKGVRKWWLVIPATLTVGLSLALPLYLYMRAGVSRSAPKNA